MKLPTWARILLFLTAFYTLVPLAANYSGWPFSLLHKTAYERPIDGRLTQLWQNRGAVTYFLNGNNLVPYEFYDFRPAHAPLAHAVLTPAQWAVVAARGLGPFLHEGDYLTKAANDSVLAVRRGAVTTYWVCPLPPPHFPVNRGLAFAKKAGAARLPRLLGLTFLLVFYRFFFAEPTSPVVVINRELGISGTVTVHSDSRGYRVYLDSSRVPYSFDDFVNEQLAPHHGLGYYLRPGDSVAKAPHATQVVVKRNGQVSTWQLAPPALPAP